MSVIEDGIPIPERHRRYHRYFFDDLAPGQSFFLLPFPGQTIKQLLIAARLASRTGHRPKFMSFEVQEARNAAGQSGVRCWRVS